MLTWGLAGLNLIRDVDYLDSGLTTSFEVIGLTDELVAMTDHLMKDIMVNDETLMLDEIHNVSPGGHSVDTEQTLKRFRDFWYPSLLDRGRREQWLAAGGATLGQRLNARAKEIVKEHRPKPLKAEIRQQLQEILAQAAR